MVEENRRGRWLPLVYYYLATVVGLVLLLVGVIGGLNGLVHAAFPRLSDEVRFSTSAFAPDERAPRRVTEREREVARREAIDLARLGGYSDALEGLITAVVGAPVFFWHLRQARRREPEWLGIPTTPPPVPPSP